MSTAPSPPPSGTNAHSDLNRTIGPYKLVERIGAGGMGEVWLAEQERPVRRRVALKLIKLGMDTRELVARFESERQALALMNHPNVAAVFDAGASEQGRPYFVMEYVPGEPITAYCDKHRLAIKERLTLLIAVCNAVQHAHQKGIIHRDIKPSNVLVIEQDGKPVPKVIDFGVAKATNQRLNEETVFTRQGVMIGTPEYMSPEQADADPLDIDTRTDIYSLGVVLYELLTGTLPFESAALRRAGYAEIQRIIREVEPPKPSTRLSSLKPDAARETIPPSATTGQIDNLRRALAAAPGVDERPHISMRGTTASIDVLRSAAEPPVLADARRTSAAEVASLRQADAATLRRQVRGDLDWIVMKCLDKDRARRYETANGLALDIARHLNNEPVLAGPPSAAYRLQKFVRRNRAAVIVATAASLTLIIGTISMAALTTWALRERTRADVAAADARQQKEAAEKNAEETKQVAEFQSRMLSSIDAEAMGRGIKDRFREQVRAALERQYLGEWPNSRKRTTEEVDIELAAFNQRAVAAEATDVARRVIGEYVLKPAGDALDKEFEDQPLVQAHIQIAIAGTYSALGLFDAAGPPLQQALELRRRELGDEHELVADGIQREAGLNFNRGDYARAEPLFRKALEMRRRLLGAEHPDVASSLSDLAMMYYAKGDYARAEPLLHDALAMRRKLFGAEHPDVAASLGDLGLLLDAKGDFAGAEPLHRDALAMRRKLLGDEHPEVAVSLNNLAGNLMSKGDHAGAEAACREALTAFRRIRGSEHPDVARGLDNLAQVLEKKGDYAGALSMSRESLAINRKIRPRAHPSLAISLLTLGSLLRLKGDDDGAEPLLREALAINRELLGPEHREVATCLGSLALLLKERGDLAAAEPLYREALAINRKVLGADDADIGHVLNNLGQLLRAKGDDAGAEPLLREALAISRKVHGAEHTDIAVSINNLALLLQARGDYDGAEPLFREALAMRRKILSDNPAMVATGVNNLALLLQARGDYSGAEPLFREAIVLYRRGYGGEHARVALAMSNLAGLLRDTGDYDGAEQLSREALTMRRRLLDPDHPDVASSLNGLAWALHGKRDYEGAEPLFREAMVIFQNRLPKGHLTIEAPRSGLAACLTKLSRFEEAEALWIECQQTLAAGPATPPKLRQRALVGFVELYSAWHVAEPDKGYDQKAAEWQARLDEWRATTQPAASRPAAG